MSNPYEGDLSVANTPGIKWTNTATGLLESFIRGGMGQLCGRQRRPWRGDRWR